MSIHVARLTALVAVGCLLSACAGQSGTADSSVVASTSSQAAAPSTAPTSAAVAGLVDIGGGRQVYADCDGVGSPTILLESGDESDTSQWSSVFPTLAEQTRTCSYDRLGNGLSDDPTGCREMKDLRGDLEALLSELGEQGPYVLVGTSGGGYLMAGFAYEHPADVEGMVLVETPHAIIPEKSPPELLALLKCNSPSNIEHRDYVTVENEAWSNRREIGDIPMTVISNDYGDQFGNEEERTNVEDQQGWFVLSPQAKQIVVTSGHNIPGNEPTLVAAEILKVVAASG